MDESELEIWRALLEAYREDIDGSVLIPNQKRIDVVRQICDRLRKEYDPDLIDDEDISIHRDVTSIIHETRIDYYEVTDECMNLWSLADDIKIEATSDCRVLVSLIFRDCWKRIGKVD